MSKKSSQMMEQVASVTRCRIERIVKRDWRGTNAALFQTPEGYFLCQVWFEQGKPKFQIRSNTEQVPGMENALETASVIAVAIQMASGWVVEEMERIAQAPAFEAGPGDM